MRAEDFDQATVDELLAQANKCFDLAKSPLEEPLLYSGDSKTPTNLDDAGKLRLLLEAQFYLTAVARKRDERNAKRDLWLEIAVIVLIGIEIILSIVAIREGNQQSRVLSNIEKSTKDSADAMSAARTSLEILSTSQTKSLDHLRQMDNSLQSSQKATGAMASATRKQLEILQDEQTNRVAQLAKKPKLELEAGVLPLNTFFDVPLKAREFTDTKITYDLVLTNLGDATATKCVLRVVVMAKDVSLIVTPFAQRPYEEPDSPIHTYLISIEYLRPKVRLPMSLTFNYQSGQPPFSVMFNIDTDELGTAVPLGALTVNSTRGEPKVPSHKVKHEG